MLDNSKNLHKRRYLKSHNIKNNIEYEFQAKFYTINIMTKFTVFHSKSNKLLHTNSSVWEDLKKQRPQSGLMIIWNKFPLNLVGFLKSWLSGHDSEQNDKEVRI